MNSKRTIGGKASTFSVACVRLLLYNTYCNHLPADKRLLRLRAKGSRISVCHTYSSYQDDLNGPYIWTVIVCFFVSPQVRPFGCDFYEQAVLVKVKM